MTASHATIGFTLTDCYGTGRCHVTAQVGATYANWLERQFVAAGYCFQSPASQATYVRNLWIDRTGDKPLERYLVETAATCHLPSPTL